MNAYKYLEELRIRSQGKPVHKYFLDAFKVKRPKTAAQLEALIEEMVNLSGGKVSIISTTGRPIISKNRYQDVLGHERIQTDVKYVPGTTIKGTPDILGVAPDGRALAIEVKYSRTDKMRHEQKIYRDKWIAAGGVHIIAKTLDDVYEYLKTIQDA